MKGVEKAVHPKKLAHCPVCGIAITVDTTVRIRPAPGQQNVTKQPELYPPEKAEDDSDG